jgi:nitrogenase subunit NifH
MTYYNELIREIGKSMSANPHSTVVMDYGSQKVLAKGVDPKKVSRKIKTLPSGNRISIVFQKPKENAVWILAKN